MGKSIINGHFQQLFWHNQRVYAAKTHRFKTQQLDATRMMEPGRPRSALDQRNMALTNETWDGKKKNWGKMGMGQNPGT